MKVSVHRLGAIFFFVAKSHVCNFTPLASAGFDVATTLAVVAVKLDVVEKTYGVIQSFGVASGADIFAESVYGESDCIELLLGIERRAVGIERPINTAKFLVVEIVDNILLSASGHLEVLRLMSQAVSCGECP